MLSSSGLVAHTLSLPFQCFRHLPDRKVHIFAASLLVQTEADTGTGSPHRESHRQQNMGRPASARVAGRPAGNGDAQIVKCSQELRAVDAVEPEIGSIRNARGSRAVYAGLAGLAQQAALQLVSELSDSFD